MNTERTPQEQTRNLVEEIKVALNIVLLIANEAKVKLTYEADIEDCKLVSKWFDYQLEEPTDKAPYYHVSKTYGNVTVKVKTPQYEKQLQFQPIQ